MGEKIAFENSRISDFQGLVTLTLDQVILHTFMHHSSTCTYIPNVIEIEETFCRRTDIRKDGRMDIWGPLYQVDSDYCPDPPNGCWGRDVVIRQQWPNTNNLKKFVHIITEYYIMLSIVRPIAIMQDVDSGNVKLCYTLCRRLCFQSIPLTLGCNCWYYPSSSWFLNTMWCCMICRLQ